MANSVADAIMHVRSHHSPTTPSENKESEPKGNPPTEFDGSARRKLETFIVENEIMFATSPRRYRTDGAKVLAAGSYLKGDPKKWFSNFFLQPEHLRPTWFHSWDEFKAILCLTWGLEDPEGAAESDLKHLVMNDKDHVNYFTSKFRAIQYRLPSWSDRNFRNVYYAALAPRIRNQFVSAGRVPPATLAELIETAEFFDRAYWANYEMNRPVKPAEDKKTQSSDKKTSESSSGSKKRKKDSNNSSSNNSTSQNTSTSNSSNSKTTSGSGKKKDPAYKKLLGPDGKLLPEERERRISNGLCLLCGQKGHLADECPKRRKQDNSSSTVARATITVTPQESSKTGTEASKSK